MAKIKVDFTDVKEFPEITAGKHVAKIKEWEMKEGEKAPYILWKLQLLTGSAKGSLIDHRTSLSPKALFGLKDLLTALGIKVPQSAISIDPDKFVGKSIGIEVNMRPYDGKEYPNVKKVFSASTVTETVETVETDDEDEDDITMEL